MGEQCIFFRLESKLIHFWRKSIGLLINLLGKWKLIDLKKKIKPEIN